MTDTTDTPPTTSPLEGGCLCGQLRYRATPEKREGYYCHCRMCQLAFGNTRVPFLNLKKGDFAWTRGEPVYYHSSKIARRGRCGHCGTPMTFEYLGSERMDIAVGTLDDPGAVPPTSHFAVESRIAAWHAEDGLPGQRLDESEKLTARWKQAYGNDVVPGIDAAR